MHRFTAFAGIISLALSVFQSDAALAQQTAPRNIAPGVLVTIDPEPDPRDMVSLPAPLPGVDATEYQPVTFPKEDTLYGQSHRVTLYRDFVWEYEFSFLGLRQAQLRLPDANGELKNRNVWYMVYRIRNTNATMAIDKVADEANPKRFKHELKTGVPAGDRKIDFRPRLTLEGVIEENGEYRRIAYSCIIDPIAVEQIRQIEDPNQRLLDSRQMSKANIPVAQNDNDPGVWGVAIWQDVDPNIDFVRVFIRGLSNAYRLGRDLDQPNRIKTLQLNFWRPGDTYAERRDKVLYGIPLVEDPREQALICQRYELPGPILQVLEVNPQADRNILVAETDAQVNLKDFTSKLTPALDSGKLPTELVQSLERSGITVDQNANVNTEISGAKWVFEDAGTTYIVQLKPQFWEPRFGKIRFIKSLDHLWIYR